MTFHVVQRWEIFFNPKIADIGKFSLMDTKQSKWSQDFRKWKGLSTLLSDIRLFGIPWSLICIVELFCGKIPCFMCDWKILRNKNRKVFRLWVNIKTTAYRVLISFVLISEIAEYELVKSKRLAEAIS